MKIRNKKIIIINGNSLSIKNIKYLKMHFGDEKMEIIKFFIFDLIQFFNFEILKYSRLKECKIFFEIVENAVSILVKE